MLNKRSVFSRSGLLTLVPLLAIILLAAPSAWAQVNTSSVRGTVKTADGNAVAGAQVTLLHVPSGNIKATTTNASGAFAFTGLRVGGPYTVTVFAPDLVPQEQTDVQLSAGKPANVSFTLKPATETIIITDTAPTPRTTSARTEFGRKDIDTLPSIGRDPKDIARLTPEAYLDDSNSQAMSIGGMNNRFNSVTIDGIRQDDDFGLNNNGYPTQRSPVSISAVEQISVETSPFDVRYGNFLGGNVNIVTKSGTNEFGGSIFGAYTSEGFTGTKSEEDELELEFSEARYGVSLSGPIVKDKVHFFVSAEGLSATTPISVGPAGSGAVNESANISAADVARVQDISRRVYGFEAGVPSRPIDETDLKFLAKVDWAISKQHRASAKYQRTRGNVVNDSFANDFNLPLTSNWYNKDDRLDAFSVRVFSDWTRDLSTEVEIAGKIVDTRQDPFGGTDFMTAEIGTADGGTIIIGPDEFRHANKLDTSTLHTKVEVNYLLGQNLFTGGAEYDLVDVFNLFVPFSNGVAEYASIDDFENRQPASIFYSNAVSNNADDGAANWGYGTLALFLQDQIDISPKLTVQGGIRVETYQSTGTIPLNQNFQDRHGFANTEDIAGKLLFLPRLGASFRPVDRLNVRGGVGLYSGGTPNVWVSNNYSNNGVTLDSAFSNDPDVIGGFSGTRIPEAMQAELMAGDGNVDALDPDFKIPSSVKVGLGMDYGFDIPALGDNGKSFNVQANYTFSKVINGVLWQDVRRNWDDGDPGTPVNTPSSVGGLPDGRDYYDNNNMDADGERFNQRRGYDMLLTNTSKGIGHTFSLAAQKRFPFGLDTYLAYAHQNVKEATPATSSRSVSNYGQAAIGLDPNDPEESTSNYERAHRVIASLRYSRPILVENRDTQLSLFIESRSGQPFSYTFGDNARGDNLARIFGEEREFARRNRMLFYVPNVNDPGVVLDGIDQAEFDDMLAQTGLDKYRGRIAPRNAFRSSWLTRMDFRFAQELAPKTSKRKAKLIFDIQNLGNLINSDWGRFQQVGFSYMVPVVDVAVDDTDPNNLKYVYSNLREGALDPERVNVLASVWRAQVNLLIEF